MRCRASELGICDMCGSGNLARLQSHLADAGRESAEQTQVTQSGQSSSRSILQRGLLSRPVPTPPRPAAGCNGHAPLSCRRSSRVPCRAGWKSCSYKRPQAYGPDLVYWSVLQAAASCSLSESVRCLPMLAVPQPFSGSFTAPVAPGAAARGTMPWAGAPGPRPARAPPPPSNGAECSGRLLGGPRASDRGRGLSQGRALSGQSPKRCVSPSRRRPPVS